MRILLTVLILATTRTCLARNQHQVGTSIPETTAAPNAATGSKSEPVKSEATYEHVQAVQAPVEVLQAYGTVRNNGFRTITHQRIPPSPLIAKDTILAAVPRSGPRVPQNTAYAIPSSTFPPQFYRPLPYSQFPTVLRTPVPSYPNQVVGYATVGTNYAIQEPRLAPAYGYASPPRYVAVAPATVYADPNAPRLGYNIHDVGYSAFIRPGVTNRPVYASTGNRRENEHPYYAQYTMLGVPALKTSQLDPASYGLYDLPVYAPQVPYQPQTNHGTVSYVQKAGSTPVFSSIYTGPASPPRSAGSSRH